MRKFAQSGRTSDIKVFPQTRNIKKSHSILRHFFDRGLAASRAEKIVSIFSCPTKSTQISAVYKLIGGTTGFLVEHYI
jgi:hypothetical protein